MYNIGIFIKKKPKNERKMLFSLLYVFISISICLLSSLSTSLFASLAPLTPISPIKEKLYLAPNAENEVYTSDCTRWGRQRVAPLDRVYFDKINENTKLTPDTKSTNLCIWFDRSIPDIQYVFNVTQQNITCSGTSTPFCLKNDSHSSGDEIPINIQYTSCAGFMSTAITYPETGNGFISGNNVVELKATNSNESSCQYTNGKLVLTRSVLQNIPAMGEYNGSFIIQLEDL